MKYFTIAVIFSVASLIASEPDCGTTGSTSVVLPNGNQPLVYVLVDFKDGRKLVGENYIEPQTESDLSGLNLNAVGSFGWNKDSAGNYIQKVHKYVYDDYWDMIFSETTYVGTKHPDFSTHSGTFDTLDNENYDLRVWGSIRDYWAEVSYNKWIIYPYTTHGAGAGKYQTGIINNIDSTSVPGKKFVKWIMMNANKASFGSNQVILFDSVEAALTRMYPSEIDFNISTYSGKLGIIYAGGHDSADTNLFGGRAEYINSTMFYHSEKVTGYSNYNSAAVLCGIADHAHEYGHAIGIPHQSAGSYDIMHVGGVGKKSQSVFTATCKSVVEVTARMVDDERYNKNKLHSKFFSPTDNIISAESRNCDYLW